MERPKKLSKIKPDICTVFWDYENCPCSTSQTVPDLVKRIKNEIDDYFQCIVQKEIILYCAANRIHFKTREDFTDCGVRIMDVPTKRKQESVDKRIIADIALNAADLAQRSQKGAICLISGDSDFGYVLSRLADRPQITAIILITRDNIRDSLRSHATVVIEMFQSMGNNSVFNPFSPYNQRNIKQPSVIFNSKHSNRSMYNDNNNGYSHYYNNGYSNNYHSNDGRGRSTYDNNNTNNNNNNNRSSSVPRDNNNSFNNKHSNNNNNHNNHNKHNNYRSYQIVQKDSSKTPVFGPSNGRKQYQKVNSKSNKNNNKNNSNNNNNNNMTAMNLSYSNDSNNSSSKYGLRRILKAEDLKRLNNNDLLNNHNIINTLNNNSKHYNNNNNNDNDNNNSGMVITLEQDLDLEVTPPPLPNKKLNNVLYTSEEVEKSLKSQKSEDSDGSTPTNTEPSKILLEYMNKSKSKSKSSTNNNNNHTTTVSPSPLQPKTIKFDQKKCDTSQVTFENVKKGLINEKFFEANVIPSSVDVASNILDFMKPTKKTESPSPQPTFKRAKSQITHKSNKLTPNRTKNKSKQRSDHLTKEEKIFDIKTRVRLIQSIVQKLDENGCRQPTRSHISRLIKQQKPQLVANKPNPNKWINDSITFAVNYGFIEEIYDGRLSKQNIILKLFKFFESKESGTFHSLEDISRKLIQMSKRSKNNGESQLFAPRYLFNVCNGAKTKFSVHVNDRMLAKQCLNASNSSDTESPFGKLRYKKRWSKS